MTEMLNLNLTVEVLQELIDRNFGQGTYGCDQFKVFDISYTGLTHKTVSQVDPEVKAYAVLNGKIIENFPKPYDILENEISSVNVMEFSFKEQPFLYVQLRSQIAYDLCREYVFYTKKGDIEGLCRKISDLNRTGKTMAVYNGDDIPIEELAKVPYVVPSQLMRKWGSYVEPQLKRKETYNSILFFGDPGSGKTAFIRWCSTQYPEWKFILVPPQAITKVGTITEVYQFAKKRVPAVVVFEDIDLMAQNRSMESTNFSHLLGELLNNLDGMEPNHKILTIASTNNPGALDPAVMRAGRLGVSMSIEYTPEEIVKILRIYYPFKSLTDEEMLEVVGGKRTPADLKSVAKVCQVYEEFEGRKMTKAVLRATLGSVGREKKFDVPPPEEFS
jgi:hypothetical protein